MSSKTLSLAAALAAALLTSGRTRADDMNPPPAPAPAPAPAPVPAPTPPTPPAPTDKPTDKPVEKPDPAFVRGFIGFNAVPAAAMDAEQRQQWHVKSEVGVVAVGITKGTPADVGGLKNGDVLLKYAGKEIPSTKDLDTADSQKVQAWMISFGATAQKVKEGEVVEIVVEREGKPVTLQATAINQAALQKIAKAAAEDDDGEDDGEDDDEGEDDDKGEKPAKPPEKPSPEKPAEPKKDAPK